MQRVAEAACKGFEKDLKEKTKVLIELCSVFCFVVYPNAYGFFLKVALDQYRKLAHEAHNAAKREREELSEYWYELIVKTVQNKTFFFLLTARKWKAR